jgi:hypothetical protein
MKPFGKAFTEKGKKGQVTPFIIVGVLIVIISGALLFINRDSISTRQVTNVQVEPIRNYIEECIAEELEIELSNLRNTAGIGNFEDIISLSDNLKVNILHDTNLGQKLPSEILIGNILSEKIKNFLSNGGCSLSSFEDNFVIDEGIANLKISVMFARNSVISTIEYPISLSRGDSTISLNDFTINTEDNFYEVYFLVRDISRGFADNSQDIGDLNKFCSDHGKGNVDCFVYDTVDGYTILFVGGVEDIPQDIGDTGNLEDLFKFAIKK